MSHNQNTIEINGNRYDASTGQLVKGGASTHSSPQSVHHPSGGKVLDGFTRRPRPSRATTPAVPSHAVHKKTTRSKTLMRHAVKKPVHQITHKPVAMDKFAGKNYTLIDPARLGRANHVPKSTLVSKFGDTREGGIKPKVAPLEVRPAPAHPKAVHTISSPAEQPLIFAELDSVNPFDLALQKSTSHKLPRTKRPNLRQRTARKLKISPKVLNVAVGVFVTLFVGGILAYQSVPQLAMKVAASRSGVRANLPSYQPSGFAISGPVQYGSGVVTLNYASRTDDRSFRVVQKNSDWNSQTLLDNFVASKEPYQTFQDKGRTVYIYDASNATWVSGGVWYQIEGESSLSSEQLRRIVSGL